MGCYRYDNVKCFINCILSFLYFSVMKHNERIEKGYQAFVKDDYTQVLNTYDDLDGKIR